MSAAARDGRDGHDGKVRIRLVSTVDHDHRRYSSGEVILVPLAAASALIAVGAAVPAEAPVDLESEPAEQPPAPRRKRSRP